MGQLYEDVFNRAAIYEILFLNVKSVLIYPNYEELMMGDGGLSDEWALLAMSNHNQKNDASLSDENTAYLQHAPSYPEFTKIVAITYATLEVVDGKLKRNMKSIVDSDEFNVLNGFMDVLYSLSSDGVKSTPNFFPTLCGHDILNNDIPLLVKKFIFYRDRFKGRGIPYMLKNVLNVKPWESDVIDTANVWKFNGYGNTSLSLIGKFLNLKRTTELLPSNVLSERYWNHVGVDEKVALKLVSFQSATQTNYVIQLINELRLL